MQTRMKGEPNNRDDCPRCKAKKQDFISTWNFTRIPKYMFFRINRTLNSNFEGQTIQKKSFQKLRSVDFELQENELDLSSFTYHEGGRFDQGHWTSYSYFCHDECENLYMFDDMGGGVPRCKVVEIEDFRQNSQKCSLIIFKNVSYEEQSPGGVPKTPTKSPLKLMLNCNSSEDESPCQLTKVARKIESDSDEEVIVLDDDDDSQIEDVIPHTLAMPKTPEQKGKNKTFNEKALSPKDYTPIQSRLETIIIHTPEIVDTGNEAGTSKVTATNRKLFEVGYISISSISSSYS